MDKEKIKFLFEQMDLKELLECNIMLNEEIISSLEFQRRLEKK